jgi:hypothetical protein
MKRSIKQTLKFIAMLMAMALLLSACGGAEPSAPASASEPPPSSEAAASEPEAPETEASEPEEPDPADEAPAPEEPETSEAETPAPEEVETSEPAQPEAESSAPAAPVAAASGKFGTPVLLTSAGQSADTAMMDKVLQRAGVEYTTDATASDPGSYKTIIIVPGVSTKGLGAAGLSAADELKRATAFAKAASDSGATVVVAHVGGGSRRDDLSNQFIDAVLPYSDYILVLNSSDEDGVFSKYASSNGIGITKAASLATLTTEVEGLFGK